MELTPKSCRQIYILRSRLVLVKVPLVMIRIKCCGMLGAFVLGVPFPNPSTTVSQPDVAAFVGWGRNTRN